MSSTAGNKCLKCGVAFDGFWRTGLMFFAGSTVGDMANTLSRFEGCFCSHCKGPMHVGCFHQSHLEIDKPIYFIGIEPLFHLVKAPGEPGSTLAPDYYLCPKCAEELKELARLRSKDISSGVVDYLEKTGRYEELAQFYEGKGELEKAGEARNRMRSQTIRHVSVDLNRLIESVRSQGLTIPYKCPNCGATLTVDGKSRIEGLKFCSYCGGAVNTELMAKILESALK